MHRLILITALAALLVGANAQAAKENFDRSKPHFIVETGDLDLSGFDSLDGLGMEVEVIEFQDGDDLFLRKRPGRAKFSDVVLTRRYRGATDLQAWAAEARRGKILRRDIHITTMKRNGTPIQSFTLTGAFPSAWELETDERGRVQEKVTLAVERMLVLD